MARRRDRGGWASGLQSMSPLLMQLLSNQLISQRQEESSARTQERQQAMNLITSAQNEAKEQRTAQRAIPQGIDTAATLQALPTERGILQKAQGAGMDITPQTPAPYRPSSMPPPPEEGALPSFNYPVTHAPAIQDLMAQRAEKEAQLKTAAEEAEQLKQHYTLKPLQFFSEPDQRMMEQYVPESQIAAYGALPQGPTPTQKGKMTIEEAKAGQLNPLYTVAKAQADNMMTDLTLPEEAKKMATLTGARERAELAPDIVRGKLGEYEGRQQIEAKYRQPTEFERRTELNLRALTNADANALDAEAKGIKIPAFAVAIAKSPGLSGVNDWLRRVKEEAGKMGGPGGIPPEVMAYVNSAVDYAATYTYIKSGVQSREEEFDRYLFNLFPIEGDGPAQIKQKQTTRAVFQAASQMSLAGNPDLAGKMLARAVKAGRIPPDIITALKLDPDVLAGFKSETTEAGLR